MHKWMAISCLHAPITHKGYWEWVLKIIQEFKPDTFINLGDWYEGKAAKKWAKHDDEKWTTRDEHLAVSAQANQINSLVPGRKVWLYGNHDDNIFGLAPDRIPEDIRAQIRWEHDKDASMSLADWKVLPYSHRAKFQLGPITFQHGCEANITAEKNQAYLYGKPYGLYIQGHCFDDETELLTQSGWKKRSELTLSDMACTLNRETDRLEWNRIKWINQYDHDGEMVRIKSRNTDLLLTGEHGLWVGKKDWRNSTANASFGTQCRIKLAGVMDREGIELSDDRIRVLAWIMAEGNLQKSKNGVEHIRIAQSDAPDGRMEVLESALRGADVEYSKILRYKAGETEHGQHRNYDAYRLGILGTSKEWASWIRKFINRNKQPLDPMFQMSKSQIDVFLEAYTWADGCVNKAAINSRQIGVKCDVTKDFLQTICALSGRRTCVISRTRRGSHYWCITINERSENHIGRPHWSREHYAGKVWCVSVDNGTLLVRRNGRTAITLNTHRPLAVTQAEERQVPLPYWYCNPGCGVQWDKMHYMQRCKMAKWGRGCVIGECTDSSVRDRIGAFASKTWDAEVLIHSWAEPTVKQTINPIAYKYAIQKV